MSKPSTVVAGLDLSGFGDSVFTTRVVTGVERIEQLMHAELHGSDELMRDAVTHLFDAGGKRFRPLFTVLAAQLGPEPDHTDISIAGSVVELIHLATLYHDDVMDEAQVRRGASSANARWGNNVAILAGDYLFATASRLVAQLGPEAVRIIAETFAELVTGQMRETQGVLQKCNTIEHYLKVVYEKTACLIATAGRFGGTFSGGTSDNIARLGRIGGAVGMAFQISDDIIDIASSQEDSGKIPGTDLREGVHTLPVLYALEQEDSIGQQLRQLLAQPLTDDDQVQQALQLLEHSHGIEKAKAMVAHYAQQARDELQAFPSSPGKQAILHLIDYTTHRHG